MIAVATFLSILPRFLITGLCELLIPIVSLGASKEKKRFYKNVDRIWGLPAHSDFAKMFFKQNLRHLVYCQIETIIGIFRPKRLHVSGLTHLQEISNRMLEQGNGLVIVTAHLGSWEFVAKYTGEVTGKAFYALAKPTGLGFLTKFLDEMRNRMGTKVLWTGRSSLMKDMLKAIKANHPLGFVMDQKPDGRKGPQVDFLGQPTEFVTGPASIALKCKSPVVGVYCLRESPWSFAVHTKVLYDPAEVEEEPSVEALTQHLASHISTMIKRYPEQWTWSYKRWRDS